MTLKTNIMNKNTSISALLGIKQKDMAQLLKVHRSQWSMFELGQRNLPNEAKLLLAEMLQHLEKEKESKGLPDPDGHHARCQNYLLGQLQENERKAVLLRRRLNAERRKYEADTTVLQLTSFLATRESHKSASSDAHLKCLAAKAKGGLQQRGPMAILRQEIQLELLQSERRLLEKWLTKYTGKPKASKPEAT